MASVQNHVRIAPEIDAANVGVAAATLIDDPAAAASAAARRGRVTHAVAALEHDPFSEPVLGRPILWINILGTDVEDGPIGILQGWIPAEAAPLGLNTARPRQRRCLALGGEAQWGGHAGHFVRAVDVRAVPDHHHRFDPTAGKRWRGGGLGKHRSRHRRRSPQSRALRATPERISSHRDRDRAATSGSAYEQRRSRSQAAALASALHAEQRQQRPPLSDAELKTELAQMLLTGEPRSAEPATAAPMRADIAVGSADDRSERARRRATEIGDALARRWGVIGEADTMRVRVDPEFDAVAAQTRSDAAAARGRGAAMVVAIAASGLPEKVKAEVGVLVAAAGSPTILRARLAAVEMPDIEHTEVEFLLDYLRGDTGHLDLLDTPVLVDPGVEARGRIRRLMQMIAEGRAEAGVLAEEIAVMTALDREVVLGHALPAVTESVDGPLWPGFVDRDVVGYELMLYAGDAAFQRRAALELAESDSNEGAFERLGVDDDLGECMERHAVRRAHLREIAANGQGLTGVERQQLTALLADIDTGRIADERDLPELLWVDERTKAHLDFARYRRDAAKLSAATRDNAEELLRGSGIEPTNATGRKIARAVFSLAGTLDDLGGGGTAAAMSHDRGRLLEQRAHLAGVLAAAGVDPATARALGELVDQNARAAATCGRTAADRRAAWQTRTDEIIAQRDDSIATREHPAVSAATAIVAAVIPVPPGRELERWTVPHEPPAPEPPRPTEPTPGL